MGCPGVWAWDLGAPWQLCSSRGCSCLVSQTCQVSDIPGFLAKADARGANSPPHTFKVAVSLPSPGLIHGLTYTLHCAPSSGTRAATAHGPQARPGSRVSGTGTLAGHTSPQSPAPGTPGSCRVSSRTLLPLATVTPLDTGLEMGSRGRTQCPGSGSCL